MPRSTSPSLTPADQRRSESHGGLRWFFAAAACSFALALAGGLLPAWPSAAVADEIGGPGNAALAGPDVEVGGGSGPVVTLSGVPAYYWYNGCGPTSAGMIIGFWDAKGFGNLIPGTNSWTGNQQAVKDMIASPGHVTDYALYNGVDDSSTAIYPDMSSIDPTHAHANNCVADFMKQAFSAVGNKYGWSWFTDQDDAMKNYAVSKGYAKSTVYQRAYANSLWQETVNFIDAGKPVQYLVDSNADGSTDHFVTVIGYDATPGALKYECLNTWDFSTHWYNYGPLTSGTYWGVYGGTFLTVVPEPGTLALLAFGGVITVWRRLRVGRR